MHEEPAIVAANLEVLAPQNADPRTQTHEPRPTNPNPQNRRSTSDHDPRPSAEHNHRQSTLIDEPYRQSIEREE